MGHLNRAILERMDHPQKLEYHDGKNQLFEDVSSIKSGDIPLPC